jgi:hypothetical protein
MLRSVFGFPNSPPLHLVLRPGQFNDIIVLSPHCALF